MENKLTQFEFKLMVINWSVKLFAIFLVFILNFEKIGFVLFVLSIIVHNCFYNKIVEKYKNTLKS